MSLTRWLANRWLVEHGFFHAPAGCDPPPMSPHDIILLDALEPGWYLYKTT